MRILRSLYVSFFILCLSGIISFPVFAQETRSQALQSAKFWLNELRKDPGSHREAWWSIERQTRLHSLTFMEIGTNQAEINQLRESGCRKNKLAYARGILNGRSAHDINAAFFLLVEELELCGYSLSELMRDCETCKGQCLSESELKRLQNIIKKKKLVENYTISESQRNQIRILLE